jgi:hypothetical protein
MFNVIHNAVIAIYSSIAAYLNFACTQALHVCALDNAVLMTDQIRSDYNVKVGTSTAEVQALDPVRFTSSY